MAATLQVETGNSIGPVPKRWVTDRVYSDVYQIPRQTLANWRHKDKVAGRTQARDGFPKYVRFGRSVRYLVQDEVA